MMKNKKDSLGDRMKSYEEVSNIRLPRFLPVIIRLDGKAFHTFTRKMEKPFDLNLMTNMAETALYLCENIQGAKFGYTQSDEISILLMHHVPNLEGESYFDNRIQKICSVAASMASVQMSLKYGKEALFDCRTFILPPDDITNYFVWRQKDFERNSIQMVAQSMYSQKELHGKKTPVLHELCWSRGINWSKMAGFMKEGFAIKKRFRVSRIVNDITWLNPPLREEWQIVEAVEFKEYRDFIKETYEAEDD